MRNNLNVIIGSYPGTPRKRPLFRASNIVSRTITEMNSVDIQLWDITQPDFRLTLQLPREYIRELLFEMDRKKEETEKTK